jgi:replicative DNA helicase
LDEKSGNYDLVFNEFNELVRGDLKGKLIVVAGQGGTKKSIYAQEILFNNARMGMRGIYNNQEMSKTQFLKRSVNMYRSGFASRKLWDEFKELYAQDQEEATKKVQEMLKDDFSKRVIVDYKLAANSGHYRSIIEQVENAYGSIDMLVVDGLSMMMDTGGEKDSAEKHTRELKYLANEMNIPVIALVHVTKDVPKHTRDLTPYLRGSGKIYDNADIFVSCSLVVDTERTLDSDVVYRNDVGYLRLFDKRDSGETINVVYNFDPNTLMMSSSNIDPASLEVKVKNRYLNADKF